MTEEQFRFAEALAKQSETHDQWVGIMKFGQKTLLEDPPVLLELIWQEANRRSANAKCDSEVLAGYLAELGLKIVPTAA